MCRFRINPDPGAHLPLTTLVGALCFLQSVRACPAQSVDAFHPTRRCLWKKVFATNLQGSRPIERTQAIHLFAKRKAFRQPEGLTAVQRCTGLIQAADRHALLFWVQRPRPSSRTLPASPGGTEASSLGGRQGASHVTHCVNSGAIGTDEVDLRYFTSDPGAEFAAPLKQRS